MNDCSNADIRDRLPDLLHDQLDAAARAVIVAHVAECVDCRDELELLQSVHKTLIARTPRVDIAYVIGALPKAPARRPHIQPARRRWGDWRIAAAVTVLIAGGSSVVVLNRAPSRVEVRAPITDSSAIQPAPPTLAASESAKGRAPAAAPVAPNAAPTTVATADDSTSVDDGPDGRFGGLSNAQMQTLLGEIDQLKPVPVTEPEPVTIRVDLKPSGPEGLR
jgi:hypothetical protein